VEEGVRGRVVKLAAECLELGCYQFADRGWWVGGNWPGGETLKGQKGKKHIGGAIHPNRDKPSPTTWKRVLATGRLRVWADRLREEPEKVPKV